MSQLQIINQLLLADLPFAAYRLPGKKHDIRIVAQHNKELSTIPIEEIEQHKGFILAPFESAVSGEIYCIRPDIYIDGDEAAGKFKGIKNNGKAPPVKASNLETTSQEYHHRVQYLVEYLNESSLEKIVFSRMMNIPPIPDFDAAEMFSSLEQKHAEAFIYMFKLPDQGLWMGATPETLFHVTPDTIATVALAGTRPTDDITWSEKEVSEQKIVRDFIHDTLNTNGISNFVERGPVTIIAGTVVHLKTIFQFPAEQLKGNMGKLIRDLHPTPAVCGLPKKEAYEMIGKLEKHDRRFYSGFSGPWNLEEESMLFVNLRCAEISESGINLYVGGGITIDSDPEAEWEETVRKSQTLLQVVEKL